MSYDSRMQEILAQDNARRGKSSIDDATLALIVSYYDATPSAITTGEPSDKNRVHRAHDTSRYPRRFRPLSGSWDDIDAGAAKVDHVKVIREDSANHLPMSAYRRARKTRANVTTSDGAAAAQARADHRASLLASVGNNSDVD